MARTPGATGAFRLRSQIWFIPMMSLVAATILALATTALDRRISDEGAFQQLFARNPEAVRTALSVVASSILTFTALVFTITMVVVQQAANRRSPRLIPTFLADRMSQVTLGLFMGTFAFSLLVLRDVRSPSEGASFVPGFSVALVFVAVLVSLGVFVSYLHHIVESLQVSFIGDRIVNETKDAIDDVYPEDPEDAAEPGELPEDLATVEWSGKPGVLTSVDTSGLLEIAGGGTVVVLRRQGEYVPSGAPIIRVSAGIDIEDVDFVATSSRRSVANDVGLGFRKLVDIAEKALSPGINDPTTAVEILDRLHTLLRMLVSRPVPSPRTVRNDQGSRVIMASPSFADYLDLATQEIAQYGVASRQVAHRMGDMLDDLITAAPTDRREVLEERLDEVASKFDFGPSADGPRDSVGVSGETSRIMSRA